MEREIKIRCWVNGIGFVTPPLPNNRKEGDNYILHFESSKNIKLMQYTGLKDKNGKEIYEGDILHNPYDESDYDIRWNDEQCAYELGEYGAMLKSYQLGEFWEVIGNVFENPELLSKLTTK